MKVLNLLLVLTFLSLMFYMCTTTIERYKQEKEIPIQPITEDECWAKGGHWIFNGDMDQYGTDQSSFTCVIIEEE